MENFNFIEPMQDVPDYARAVLIDLTKISQEQALFFESYLDPTEQLRLQNITNKEKYHSFVVCRYVVKQLIGDFFGLDPLLLNFQYTGRGKPYVSSPGIEFNISHSGDYAVIGVSRFKIGVDIEKIKPNRDFKRLAEAVLSEDEKTWVFKQDTVQRFYQLWTLKEARLKCDGDGLAGHYPAATFDAEKGWLYNGYIVLTHIIDEYIHTVCISVKD